MRHITAAAERLQAARDEFATEVGALAASADLPDGPALARAEADRIIAAVAHSDGRLTATEVAVVPAGTTPIDEDPELYVALRAHGPDAGWRYYQAAVRLAYGAALVDGFAGEDVRTFVRGWTTGLLRRLDPEAAGDEPTTDDGDGGPPDGAERPPITREAIDDALAELDALIGLAHVKAEIRLVADAAWVGHLRRQAGLKADGRSLHMVFSGNPGTGKTTVARIVARIYHALGVLAEGHLVETDRSGLVAGYVGQTAIKTREKVTEALGGVLVVDEAYGLTRESGTDFGHEAVEALLKMMEDHRHELVVIVTGYVEEMATFLASNPGLRDRFPTHVRFADYSADELVEIFERQVTGAEYRLADDEVRETLRRAAVAAPGEALLAGRAFGNARWVRNLFERTLAQHASRISALSTPPTHDELQTLTLADLDGALRRTDGAGTPPGES